MSTKEIKSALKAAKTSIQAKDFQTALQHCELVLKKDAHNYNALVFAGLCYSETNQNEKAREKYKVAIESQPDQILAYQGFANLYMKHWKKKKTKEELNELISIYEKLLKLTDKKDTNKRRELLLNLCNVNIEAELFIKTLQIISDELDVNDSEEDCTTSPFHEIVCKALKKFSGTDWTDFAKFSGLIEKSFNYSLRSPTNETKEVMSYLKTYVKFLQNDSNILEEKLINLLDVCVGLHNKYPDEILPMEIILQAQLRNYDHPGLPDQHNLVAKLNDCSSNFANLGVAFVEYKDGNFEKAVTSLSYAMNANSTYMPGWIILCETLVKLRKFTDLRQFARTALLQYKQISSHGKPTWLLPIIPLDVIQYELSKNLATGLCGSHIENEIMKGIGTFEKLVPRKPKDLSLHIRMTEGFIKLNEYDKASDSIKKAFDIDSNYFEVKAWTEYIRFKTEDEPSAAISRLRNIAPPSGLSRFLLGKAMWEAGGEYRTEKKNCFTALVEAAKDDPYRSEIFFLLGHFYSEVQHNLSRARGCYQKAYSLDQSHEETAVCLADAYIAEGDTTSAIKLYENITKGFGSTGGKWAWLRLGLCKLKAKDISNAIKCFLSALRIDAVDAICWECLGEGYLQRGSYSASWKAFDRAHQLNPKSVYSLYQMAKVKQVQGLYADAITEYNEVLNLMEDYVPALQGLGESELSLGRQMFHEGRYQTGIEHFEKAIMNLTVACSLRKDLCCLWKLLGDCCVMVQSLDVSVVQLNVPSIFLNPNDKDIENTMKAGKNEILSLSTKFYCRAIQIQPDNGSLWHDLGLSYFRRAEESKRNARDNIGEMADNAVNAMKKAITLESSNHLFWNSLGVIAASGFIKDPALAQHCFLTSIKHEQNNVEAWSNLATLYLSHDHIKQAHEAFKVAQSLEPSFVNSWVGQALIAETIGSNETMDLFRHSTELGSQKQGGIGYSSWVARVIADTSNHESSLFKENIRNMNAVTTATTQMSKLCDKNSNCPWSSTIHGFLLEHSGLNRSAESAYRQSYNAMKNMVSKDEKDEKSLTMKKFNSVANLARILSKNGSHNEAISLYEEILSSPFINFYDVCELALAYYKSGKFDKALASYEKAGQLVSSDDDKAQVMVAMAMTYWKMGKHDEAKTLLYQCFQKCKAGLRALLSLGIATGDKTLVGAAVGELINKKSANSHDVGDDCLLIASAAELCEDDKLALSEVEKALHLHPFNWSLRILLCRLLVHLPGCTAVRSAPVISTQAKFLFDQQCVTNPLNRDSQQWKGPLRQKNGVNILKCSAMSTVSAGSHKTSSGIHQEMKEKLRKAQIFAHMHPYDPSAWSLLCCASHGNDVVEWLQDKPANNNGLVESLSQQTLIRSSTSKREMESWCQSITAWNKTLTGADVDNTVMVTDSMKFIYLLSNASCTIDKPKLQSIFKEITNIIGKTTDPGKSSKYFGELLEHLGMFHVSKKLFEKSIALNNSNPMGQLSTYFRIIQLAYKALFKDETKAKEWLEVMKNVVCEIVKIDVKSPQSLFIQGLVLRMDQNHRKSRSLFNRVINSTEIISDDTRSLATWYQYRNLHERNDTTEIQKLVEKSLERNDQHIARLVGILPGN
ncbi:tetratricopeptide repeat protein 37-like isoform X1 [Styela clava]